MDPYQNLANAIILLAVRDYRIALKALKMNPNSRSALVDKREIERFFRSDWYELLTDLDGELLIRRLNEEEKDI